LRRSQQRRSACPAGCRCRSSPLDGTDAAKLPPLRRRLRRRSRSPWCSGSGTRSWPATPRWGRSWGGWTRCSMPGIWKRCAGRLPAGHTPPVVTSAPCTHRSVPAQRPAPCLSACLPVCLSVCLSVCLPACLPACLFDRPSVRRSRMTDSGIRRSASSVRQTRSRPLGWVRWAWAPGPRGWWSGWSRWRWSARTPP
jgi:hypothetical protein